MNKNVKRIVSMTLLLGTISTIVPENFIFRSVDASAATYDNAKNGNLKELNLYGEDGLKLKITKDGFYDKEISSLADTDEYYVLLDDDSDYISIEAEIAGDGSNVVKAFNSNNKDENGYDIKDGKKNNIRVGDSNQTIYLRTYRSESDYKYALKRERVNDCIKTYTIHVRKTKNTSKSESYKTSVYLKDLYLSDCDIDFSKKVTNYYINVDENMKEVLLRAVPNDSDSTVQLNEEDLLKEDNYEKTLKLEKGENVYKIVVENDDDILTYTLNIYRGKDKKYEDKQKENDSKLELGQTNNSSTNTWKKQDGKWQYIDGTGQPMKNKWWFDVNDGNNYYLDGDGYAATGWKAVNGKWYYFNEGGAMQTGWIKLSGKWYYLNKGGVMQTGWIKDSNNKWYYLSNDGAMMTGWIQDTDGNWYYMNDNGEMSQDTVIDGYKIDANGYWVQ